MAGEHLAPDAEEHVDEGTGSSAGSSEDNVGTPPTEVDGGASGDDIRSQSHTSEADNNGAPQPASAKKEEPPAQTAEDELRDQLLGPPLEKVPEETEEVDLDQPLGDLPEDYRKTLHARTQRRIEHLARTAKASRAELDRLKQEAETLRGDAQVFQLLQQTVPQAIQARQAGQALPADVEALRPIHEALAAVFGAPAPAQATPATGQAPPAQAATPDAEAIRAQAREAMIDMDYAKAEDLLTQLAKAEATQAPAMPAVPEAQLPQAGAGQEDPLTQVYATEALTEMGQGIGAKTAQETLAYFQQAVYPRIVARLQPVAQAQRTNVHTLFEALPAADKYRLSMDGHRAEQAARQKAQASRRAAAGPRGPLSAQEAHERVARVKPEDDVEGALKKLLAG